MSHKIAKYLSYFIPAIVFIFLLPIFEQPQENKQAGFVLGAFTTAQAQAATASSSVALAEKLDRAPIAPAVYQSAFSAAPEISAKALLVYDMASGANLYQSGAQQKLQIASLTKIMTAIIASEDPDYAKTITITANDVLSIAPMLSLKPGDRVMPEDLLKAMLIGSANDAAKTLANHFPKREEFVARMNAKAVELGMSSTHFSTPVGFDAEDNYSTAGDLAKLVQYALQHLPYTDIWQTINYRFSSLDGNVYAIRNSNQLVYSRKEIRSIKTGSTPLSQQSMIVQAENQQGHKIIVIVLGAADRDSAALKLIDYIFHSFSWN